MMPAMRCSRAGCNHSLSNTFSAGPTALLQEQTYGRPLVQEHVESRQLLVPADARMDQLRFSKPGNFHKAHV